MDGFLSTRARTQACRVGRRKKLRKTWMSSAPSSPGSSPDERDTLMDKDQLIKKLMVTFLEELEEHVRSLNADLLALEKAAEGTERAERLTTLFRTAHSLK